MAVRSAELGASTGLLRSLIALDSVDVAFAARVDPPAGTFVLDRFEGARTDRLLGVVSQAGLGLGGRCIALRRPVFVAEYAAACGITHHFDRQVAEEGLRAVFAIPVVGERAVREIVYGASRRSIRFSERLIDSAVDIVNRSEVPPQAAELVRQGRVVETIGEVRAALVEIAKEIVDSDVRQKLLETIEGLPADPDSDPGSPPVKLSRRELDVLSEVARGFGNRRVGERLGISEQTVKSYMKSAMFKLNSSTRGEAVFRARNAGLLAYRLRVGGPLAVSVD